MKKIIQNLREKPEHHRHKIAFWTALGITAVIFVIWVSTFNFSSKQDNSTSVVSTNIETKQKNLLSNDTTMKTEKDSKTMTASVGSLWQDIKSSIFSPKKVIYTEVEVKPGN
jgi:hypothetical protein